jgi:Leucine-rich repeat (LRR) protein
VESRLERLSEEECSRVTKLALSSNLLINLPESVSRLCNLRDLSLDRNGLATLPVGLGVLTRLQTILLVGNPGLPVQFQVNVVDSRAKVKTERRCGGF